MYYFRLIDVRSVVPIQRSGFPGVTNHIHNLQKIRLTSTPCMLRNNSPFFLSKQNRTDQKRILLNLIRLEINRVVPLSFVLSVKWQQQQ